MIAPLYVMLWGSIFLVFQSWLRLPFFGGVEIDLTRLVVIYAGFSLSFFRGGIAVIVVSYLAETMSYVPHGTYILIHLLLFCGLRMIVDQIISEAYLTKGLWVFVFGVIGEGLTYFFHVGQGETAFNFIPRLFGVGAMALASVPVFLWLDKWLDPWEDLFSRQRAHVTGADIYQAKRMRRLPRRRPRHR